MTISQHRVISILNAGIDYRQAFERLIRLIDEQHEAAAHYSDHSSYSPEHTRRNLIESQKIIKTIYLSAGDTLLVQASASRVALETAHAHFKANYKRNERNRVKAAQKRRDQGIMPRVKITTPFLEISPVKHQASQHKLYTEHAPEAKPRFVPSPLIDLSTDPDDPENAFDSGTGFVSNPTEDELRAALVQQSLLVEGETEADREARRRFIAQAIAKDQEDRVNRSLVGKDESKDDTSEDGN